MMQVGKFYHYNHQKMYGTVKDLSPWECVHISSDGWATLTRMTKDHKGDPIKSSTTTLVSDDAMYEVSHRKEEIVVFINDRNEFHFTKANRGSSNMMGYIGTIGILVDENKIISVTY